MKTEKPDRYILLSCAGLPDARWDALFWAIDGMMNQTPEDCYLTVGTLEYVRRVLDRVARDRAAEAPRECEDWGGALRELKEE